MARLSGDADDTILSTTADRKERFYREARAAAALDDPHIVTIYEVGEFAGGCFIAMEYIAGRTMKRLIEEGPPPLPDVCDIGVAVCRALRAAHGRGIIHRDIKSENIMRTDDGRVKVLDFGLARDTAGATITRSGDIMGTPAYMPPEQALGEAADARSDIYSLGVVLYEAVTGRLPFMGDNPVAVLYALVNEEPRRPRDIRPVLPEEMEKIVLKAMMKEPDRRYARAEDLANDLAILREYLVRPEEGAGPVPALLATEEVYEARRRRFEPELIGRRRELERLTGILEDALAGRSRTVIVGGEAGIGKSRLVAEIQQRARAKRAANLVGRCHFGQGAYPYQPLVEATRRHLAGLGIADEASFEAQAGAEWPEVVPHVKALGAFLHFSTEPLDESARREQLWEAYRRLLVALAGSRPMTFLVEDLHWADESTLALAVYVITRIRDSRLLFLGTYRPEEPSGEGGVGEKLLAALQALSREDWFTSLPLERLGCEQVALIVRSLLGDEGLGERVEGELWRETEGNPFYLIETLKFLVQEGKLVEEEGRWTLASPWDPSMVPGRVHDLVIRRLEPLAEAERDILELAAVQGEVFESDVLSEGLGVNRVRLLKALQRLEKQHHLVRPTEKGFAFDHATIRRALYESISPDLRREYHRTVGRVLAGRAHLEPGRAAAVAHHLLAGGEPAGAVPFLIGAARDAGRVFANAEAREGLSRAIAILDGPGFVAGPGGTDATALLIEALGLLGDVDLATGRADGALAAYERMRGLARRAGRATEEGAAGVGVGLAHYNRSEFPRALASFEASVVCFRSSGDRRGLARALDKIGNVQTKQGRYDAALALHEESLAIRREVDDRLGVAESLNNISIVYRNCGRLDEALRAQEQALGLKREAGDRRGTASSLINMGNVLFLLRRSAEALERYKEALRICREIGDRRLMAYPLSAMGNTFFEGDEYEAAVEHYRLALGIYEELKDRWGSGRVLNNLGVVQLRRAEYGGALDSLTRSLALKAQVDDARSRGETLVNIGEAHRRTGRLDEAASVLGEAGAIAGDLKDDALGLRAAAALGALAADRGDAAGAESLLAAALAKAEETGHVETEIFASAELARLLAGSDAVRSAALAERAAARACSAGNAYDRAFACSRLAASLQACGRPDPGVVGEACGAAREFRFREILLECRRLEILAALGGGRASDAAAAASEGVAVLDEILALAPGEARESYLSGTAPRAFLEAAALAFAQNGQRGEEEALRSRFGI
jgi:tetratricopeptide (TPR) repeat protein